MDFLNKLRSYIVNFVNLKLDRHKVDSCSKLLQLRYVTAVNSSFDSSTPYEWVSIEEITNQI